MDFNSIQKSTEEFQNRLQYELNRKLSSADNIESDEPKGFNMAGFTFGNVPPSMNSTEFLRSGSGWVYACVSAIADACASIELELYQVKGDEVVKIENHPILDLLAKVNPFQTEFDHRWLSSQYLELAGEAPWFIDRGVNKDSDPQNIMLLMPDRLAIRKSPEGSENPIDAYIYKLDGSNTFEISPEEMVFIKYPDPTNPWRGRGTLAAGAVTVDIDNFSEEYNKRFFYNSATPNSILSTDNKLTPKQRDELNRSIKKMYQGKENAHKTALLESGLKWQPMQMSQRDMDFVEQQRFSMAKILSIFRVPKPIVAISDDVNLANAKIAEYVFSKWTIRPKMTRIVAQLNEFFIPMFKNSEGLFLTFKDPVPQDTELDLKRYQTALASGYMTINEVRKEQGLDEIGSEGDVIYLPFGLQPLGSSAGKANEIKTLKAFGVKSVRYYKSAIISNSGSGYRLAVNRLQQKQRAISASKNKGGAVQRIEQRIDALSMAIAKSVMQKQWKSKKEQEEQARENKRKEAVTKYVDVYLKKADEFEKSLINTTNEQFRRQLDVVLSQAPKKKVNVDDWFLDEDEEAKIMVGVFTPEMTNIIKQQGNNAGLLVGMGADNFDIRTRAVQAYLKKRTYRFSKEITQETNAILGRALKQGVAEGEGIPALRKRVEKVFGEMESYRSERIARSEVIRASNFAATEAYEQSGVVEGLEWLVASDDRLCPYCEPLDGKSVKLGDSFFDKGDTYTGSDGTEGTVDYEIINHPPLHVNCRCTVVPIVKGVRSFDPLHRQLREKKLELDEAIEEHKAKTSELDNKIAELDKKDKELVEKIEQGEISIKNAAKESKALAEERKRLGELRDEILTAINE